jgi:hypothetical protein
MRRTINRLILHSSDALRQWPDPALLEGHPACHDGAWLPALLSQAESTTTDARSRTAWMITAPMLADFAIRLAFGLAVSLLMTSWRAVPLGFFRTQALVILGLLVLAGLDQARAEGAAWAVWGLVAAAVMAYLSAIMWGLGLPRFGAIASLFVVLITAVWLGVASESARALFWLHGGASRLASGFLLGSTLTAMLLGHHYLTAPAMSIEPLKRVIGLIAWALAARCVLAALGIWLSRQGTIGGLVESMHDTQTSAFLAARWGMGFVGAAIATFMTWKTAQIRSTQSATGILYIAMIFVLFGELTAMIMAGGAGTMY